MKNVQSDVRRLQDKFKLRYDESMERATADLRDIPPLSGRIIWARQIENQLATLMKRMEDVLGIGWEAHFEGRLVEDAVLVDAAVAVVVVADADAAVVVVAVMVVVVDVVIVVVDSLIYFHGIL